MTWNTSGSKDLVDPAGLCKDSIVLATLLGKLEDVRSAEWVGNDVTILLVEVGEGGIVINAH